MSKRKFQESDDDYAPSYEERRALLDDWRQAQHVFISRRPFGSFKKITRLRAYHKKYCQLPILAKEIYGDQKACGWGPTLREMIVGIHDGGSPLSALRGFEDTVVRNIYSYITHEFLDNVTLTFPSHYVDRRGIYRPHPDACCLHCPPQTSRCNPTGDGQPEQGFVAFATIDQIQFPAPDDRNVNMLPFVFGDKSSLPSSLQSYYDCIERCPYPKDYAGKVGYLTVHESHVEAGSAQRREGLHIEAPGSIPDTSLTPGMVTSWGAGFFSGKNTYKGGIYMASSVVNTSEVWDALVHKDVPGVVDKHGGCEHLRHLIGTGTKLQANQLIWMTDCTPHQALLQEEDGYRQFFRVVTPNISHWFAAHSTKNPLVPLPDNVIVVESNKFE